MKRFNKIKPVARTPGAMNKTEAAYAAILELRKRAGEIREYKYESVTFKLAPDTRYTPDFYVVFEDRIELHEVKGGLVREDAWIKFKLAVELFPEYGWKFCQYKNKATGWNIKEF